MAVRQTTERGGGAGLSRWVWGFLWLLAALAVGGAAYWTHAGGFGEVRARRQRLLAAQQAAAALQAETDSLRLVLWLLLNDLEYVEKVAREEYGMSRPSELIFRLPAERQRAAEQP